MGGSPTKAWADFKANVAAKGGVVLETQWLGSAVKHRIRCEKGHEWSVRPNSVQRGQGICSPCSGSHPATAWEQFKTKVEEFGGTVVEPKWLGKDKRHRIICANGHRYSPRPGYVQRGGYICSVCTGNDSATAWEQFRTRVEKFGGTVVETEWLGKATPHRVICAKGHLFTPTPNNMRSGTGRCLKCVGIDPEACWEWFKARVEELGGRVIEPRWLGDGAPHRVVCSEGHEGSPIPSGVKQGQGICHQCRGMVWDVFYIVQDQGAGRVKFGITSGDQRPRLRTHAADGYTKVVRVETGLPGTFAHDLENSVRYALDDAGISPVRGREYFPISATPLILAIVQEHLREIGR